MSKINRVRVAAAVAVMLWRAHPRSIDEPSALAVSPPPVATGASADPIPADPDGPENADSMPPEPAPDAPICPEVESVAEPDSDPIAPPRPLADESVEARILHLRNSLRVAHEARPKGPFSGPFFARLARIWRKIGSAK